MLSRQAAGGTPTLPEAALTEKPRNYSAALTSKPINA